MAITYGVDIISNTTYNALDSNLSYTAFYTSPFFTVGNNLQKRKFKEIEVQLAQYLRSGEGIKLEYRTELNGTWLEIKTVNYTTFGALTSKNIVTELPSDIKACEQVQFKVSLTSSDSATAGATTPYLKNVIVR